MPNFSKQGCTEGVVHAPPRSPEPAALDICKHGKTASRPNSITGGSLNSPTTTPPSTSKSNSGYAMRHSLKDAAVLDSTSPKIPAISASGGSYANSIKASSRRGSITEKSQQHDSHKRTASADISSSWAAEAQAELSNSSTPATTATPTIAASPRRYSAALSYSQRHSCTPAAALEPSPAQAVQGNSTSEAPTQQSRQASNKSPTPPAATATVQPVCNDHDKPLVVADGSTESAKSVIALDGSSVQGPEEDASAAAIASQVAAQVVQAIRSGSLSAHASFKQQQLATTEAVEATETATKPGLQVQTVMPVSAAGQMFLEPPSTETSPSKERGRFWGFDSPKREKSGGRLLSSEPSSDKEKSSNRFWGSENNLRKKKSSKEIKTADPSTAASVAAPPVSDSSSSDGQRPVPKKEGSKHKLWKSDAARAVASIFGSDSFNALKKSLSNSGRTAAAAAVAIAAAEAETIAGPVEQGASMTSTAATAASSTLAHAEAADSCSQQQQLQQQQQQHPKPAVPPKAATSVIEPCPQSQQDVQQDMEGLSLLTPQPALPEPVAHIDDNIQSNNTLPEQTTTAAAAAAVSYPDRASEATTAVRSYSLSSSAADVSIPRSPSSLLSSTADFRYSELLFRLQQFLPALKSSATDTENFESVWEMLKSELCGLVSTAKLASVQADRLESLDAEVMQLQMMLVEVGRNINKGAQQQQLQHLVQRFPSFARRQINSDAPAAAAAQNKVATTAAAAAATRPTAPCLMSPAARPSSSKFPTANKSAAAAAGAIRAKSLDPSVHDKDVAAAAAAAAAGKTSGRLCMSSTAAICTGNNATSSARRCSGGNSFAGSGIDLQQPLDFCTSETTAAAAAAAAAAAGHTLGNNRYTGAYEVVRYPAAGSCGSSRSRSPAAAAAGVGVGRPVSPASPSRCVILPPTPKELTADEAAQLMGLYRAIRNEPERISYHKMPGIQRHSSSSSSTSPDSRRSRSTSPAAAAAAAASPKHSIYPGSNTNTSHFTVQVAAEDSVQNSNMIKADSEQNRGGGGGGGESCRSSWDYAHVGSSAGLGVAKGFKIIKMGSADRKQSGSAGGGVAPPSCRSPTRQHVVRSSVGSLGSSISIPEKISAAINDDNDHENDDGDGDDHIGARSAKIKPSRVDNCHNSSGLSSSLVARTSDHSKGLNHITSLLRQSESEQSDEIAITDPKATSTAGSSGGSSSVGYQYVRARSASPNLGLHYLDHSPIRSRKISRPGAAAASKGQTAAAAVAASTRRRHPLSFSTGSLSLGLTKAGALTGMLSSGDGGFSGCSSNGDSSRLKSVGVVWSGGLTLADDPAFRAACQAFRAEQDGCSGLMSSLTSNSGNNSGSSVSDLQSCSAKLVAKLSPSPMRDAGSDQVDAAVHKLNRSLQSHGALLQLKRLGPFTFSAAGRKLRLRMLNGNLLVRSGGGCMDLLVALGRLPLADGSTNTTYNHQNGTVTVCKVAALQSAPCDLEDKISSSAAAAATAAAVGDDDDLIPSARSSSSVDVVTSLTDGAAFGLGGNGDGARGLVDSSSCRSVSPELLTQKMRLFSMQPTSQHGNGR